MKSKIDISGTHPFEAYIDRNGQLCLRATTKINGKEVNVIVAVNSIYNPDESQYYESFYFKGDAQMLK